MSTNLFGPNRVLLGYEDTPWSVWVLGPDDIHDQPTLGEALILAAEINASLAAMRMQSTSEYDPVMYAVVLHHGYAWSRKSPNCGRPGCQPCANKGAAK